MLSEKTVQNMSDTLTLNVTLTSADYAYIAIVNVTSLLSMMGNLAVIGWYTMYKDVRTHGRRMIMFLCVANFVCNFGGILQVATYFKSVTYLEERGVLCETASMFTIYGSVSSFLWVDCVAFYVFMCVTLRLITVVNRLDWLFHVFSWGMPAIITLCAGASDVFGYDDDDVRHRRHATPCWISDRVDNQMEWYYVTIEGWAVLTYVFGGILYIVITITVQCQKGRVRQRHVDKEYVIEDMAISTANKQLRFIPAIFIALRMWGTMHLMVFKYGPMVSSRLADWLLIVKGFGDNALGIANCVIFLLATKPLRQRLVKNFRKNITSCTSWCRRNKPNESWKPSVIFRKIKTRKHNALDISEISLDFPDQDEMLEDEIVFERD
ncbi:G-protein coupled receptor 157-like [Gigantopelta aegis]|uniref:G-protein coupled receptor 157-like n=1 Tax=Gigantopelta aegis TaxID=1735272 RepID=UPI001B88B970|nr:G-protein coupled receptor 157-like [Gigantopelta aegis]